MYFCRVISQSDNKPDLIFAAATRLFAKNGFHATPTSLIAKEAGVSNGTLFHHFSTKEDLINSLYFSLKKEIFDAALLKIDEKEPFFVTLKKIWNNIIDWSLQYPDKFSFVQQFSNSPYITNVTKGEVDKLNNIFSIFIKIGIAAGEVKDIPLDVIFLTIHNQLMGLIQFLLAAENREKEDELREYSFRLLTDSLKVHKR